MSFTYILTASSSHLYTEDSVLPPRSSNILFLSNHLSHLSYQYNIYPPIFVSQTILQVNRTSLIWHLSIYNFLLSEMFFITNKLIISLISTMPLWHPEWPSLLFLFQLHNLLHFPEAELLYFSHFSSSSPKYKSINQFNFDPGLSP